MVLECRVRNFLKNNPDIFLIGKKYTCKKSPYKVKIPKKESKEIMRFLGVLHGDGNISGKRILITEKDGSFCEIIKSLFEKIFTIVPNIFYDKNRNSNYCHIKNSVICRYLVEVLEMPSESVRDNIKIPGFMKRLPLKLKTEYIGGLFDAESWLTKRQAHIGFSITNKKIRDFISKILLRLGISHSITFRNRRENKEFEIHIYGKQNLKKFKETVGLKNPRKANFISTFY